MLVLTRNENERVVITLPDGRDIWITVTRIDGRKVRLGFDADRDININREEVHAENLRRTELEWSAD